MRFLWRGEPLSVRAKNGKVWFSDPKNCGKVYSVGLKEIGKHIENQVGNRLFMYACHTT